MSDSKPEFFAVHGFVGFLHENPEASGKGVRNLTLRAVGSQKTVRVALWGDKWGHVPVKKGDVVTAEGTYTTGSGQKDGVPVTYHNLTAFALAVNGVPFEPQARNAAPVNAGAPAAADDAPF